MTVWRNDLDPADVGEMSRRVARPVVSQWLHPAEFERCSVEVVLRPGRYPLFLGGPSEEAPHFAPYVACRIDVGSDYGEFILDRLDFTRADREDVDATLSDRLQDWLVESSLSWGQLRAPHPGLPVGRAVWPSDAAGRPMLEVYPDEESDGLLWRQAEPVPAHTLDLSPGLRLALQEWRARWITGLEGRTPLPVIELERARGVIVRQLQIELHGTHEIAVPISLDPTSWPDDLTLGEEESGRVIQIGQPFSWQPECPE